MRKMFLEFCLLQNDANETGGKVKVGNDAGRIILDEPLSLLCDVVASGAVDDSFVGVHRVVGALVFLREVFAFVSRLVTVDEDCHDSKQQEDDQQ